MREITETLRTPDGFPLQVRQWRPEGTPRALVQILHGLAEHCARYGRLAGALVAAGYAVVTHDHRGHGLSVRDEDDRGHFADEDGFGVALADVELVLAHALGDLPDLPVVLLGHSMGSTIALLALQDRSEAYAAAVLSGPTGEVPGLLRRPAFLLTKLERLRLGRRGRSRLLHALSFGDFNKAFAPTRTEFDWLSRDPDEVDKYANDPHCGFIVTTQHWHDHLAALGRMADGARLARIRPGLPILVIAGALDPVSKATSQIGAVLARLGAGGRDLGHTFYPDARHELFNEVNRDEVTSDVIAWLDAHLPGATAPAHG